MRPSLRLPAVAAALLLAAPLATRPAAAQHPAAAPPARSLWGAAGIGLGAAGFVAQLDLSHARGNRLLRGRLAGHANPSGLHVRPDESLSEAAVLVGAGRPCCGRNWGSLAAGLGVVTGERGWDAERYRTVGLAAEASLLSRRRPRLQLAAFGNLNPERSFAGVTLSLAVGRTPLTGEP